MLSDYPQKLGDCHTDDLKVLFRPLRQKRLVLAECLHGNGITLFHADSRTRQFNHIDAAAAMLRDYRNVIVYIPTHYSGVGGEWHADAACFGSTKAPLLYISADHSTIMDSVLAPYAAGNLSHAVELRRPVFGKEVIDRNPGANAGLPAHRVRDHGRVGTLVRIDPDDHHGPVSFSFYG